MKAVLGIIADDFTGSNDTGVQFSKKGARTAVVFDGSRLGTNDAPASVVVIDTESRFDKPQAAAAKVAAAAEALSRLGVKHMYKKLDSTMRGNIGAEIEAAMKASGRRRAVVAPALPSNGRTTVGSQCLVNGVPVAETETRRDPRTPVLSSSIPEIIALQSNLSVRSVGVEPVRSGVNAVRAAIETGTNADAHEIVVVDAETDDDLLVIGEAVFGLEELVLLVGTAGLAGHLPSSMYGGAEAPVGAQRPESGNARGGADLPFLFVIGTVSGVTRAQTEQLLKIEPTVQDIMVDLEALFAAPDKEHARVVQAAKEFLGHGQHCIVRTTREDGDAARAVEIAGRHGISSEEAGSLPAQFLGRLSSALMDEIQLGGVFISGGDTAIRVAEVRGATGFVVGDEVLPGIPSGSFIQPNIDDERPDSGSYPVITKAGGFGKPDALLGIFRYMKEYTA